MFCDIRFTVPSLLLLPALCLDLKCSRSPTWDLEGEIEIRVILVLNEAQYMKTCKGIEFDASAALPFGKDSKLLIGLAGRMDPGVGLGAFFYRRVISTGGDFYRRVVSTGGDFYSRVIYTVGWFLQEGNFNRRVISTGG